MKTMRFDFQLPYQSSSIHLHFLWLSSPMSGNSHLFIYFLVFFSITNVSCFHCRFVCCHHKRHSPSPFVSWRVIYTYWIWRHCLFPDIYTVTSHSRPWKLSVYRLQYISACTETSFWSCTCFRLFYFNGIVRILKYLAPDCINRCISLFVWFIISFERDDCYPVERTYFTFVQVIIDLKYIGPNWIKVAHYEL